MQEDVFTVAFGDAEREALGLAYRRHIAEVRAIVGTLFSVYQRPPGGDVDDIVQNAFLKAFSERARVPCDMRRDPRPFLATVARNELVDWIRRARREIVSSSVADAAADVAATTLDQGDMQYPPGLIEVAITYIQQLPPNLAHVYRERFVTALTQEQAAATLGITRQVLRTREKRILDGLRRALSQAGFRLPRRTHQLRGR